MKREYNYIPEWDIDISDLTAEFVDIQTFIDEHIYIEARTVGSCKVEYDKGTYDNPPYTDLVDKEYDVEILAIYDAESGVDFKKIIVDSYYDEMVEGYQHKILNWYKDIM